MNGRWKPGRLVKDLTALVSALSVLTCIPTRTIAQALPKPQHVFIIVLEN